MYAIPLEDNDALVRLNFHNNQSVCTGFFINPTTIVTAAHCLFSSPEKLWNVSDVSISNDVSLAIHVEKIIPHPKYRVGQNEGNDVGFIKTSTFSSKKSEFKLNLRSPSAWGMVSIMGAGRVDLEKGTYGRSKGTASYIRTSKFIYMLGKSKNTENPGNGVTVAPNDSGGPILDIESGGVIAISSQTTIGSTKGTFLPAISI